MCVIFIIRTFANLFQYLGNIINLVGLMNINMCFSEMRGKIHSRFADYIAK